MRRDYISRYQETKCENGKPFFAWRPQVPEIEDEIIDFPTSIYFAENCRALQFRFPEWGKYVVPLCLVASGDGIAMTTKISGHPVSCRIVQINPQFVNALESIFRLGATARVLGQTAARKPNTHVTFVNQFGFQTSMHLIFEHLWPLTHTGFVFEQLYIDNKFRRCLVVPNLVRFTGDLLELLAVRSMKNNGLYGHLKFIIHKDEYGRSSQVNICEPI